MKQEQNDLIQHNRIFIWLAVATGALLLVPLAAMQLTSAVAWNTTDFIVMGLLLFGAGSLFVLVARKASRRRRVVVGIIVAAVFLLIWAELAVGVFTNLGS